MNIDRWVERIYVERDLSRNIASSVAGIFGLLIYLWLQDWVIAAFSALIVFPISKIFVGVIHSAYRRKNKGKEDIEKARIQFNRLSEEEKGVLFEFVRIGGSVMSWSHANKVGLHEPAVSSLMQRGILYPTMTADGMGEAFGITVGVFDVAKEKFDETIGL